MRNRPQMPNVQISAQDQQAAQAVLDRIRSGEFDDAALDEAIAQHRQAE